MVETITLVNFLSPDLKKLPRQLTSGIEGAPELKALKALATQLPSIQWASLLQTASSKVRNLLQVPISSILVRAWEGARDVQAALNKTRNSPDETEMVGLVDHTIESEHEPYLEVSQNGKRIGRITFPVLVEIQLRGLLLEITGGRIRKIASGEIWIRGTLKVGKFTLVEKEFEPVRAPGEIRFEEDAAASA